jgi:hypothetical protein
MGDTVIFYSDAFVSVPGMQSELYRLNVLTGAVHPLNLGRRLRSVCLRGVCTDVSMRARACACLCTSSIAHCHGAAVHTLRAPSQARDPNTATPCAGTVSAAVCAADTIGPDRLQATPTALRTAQPAPIQPRSLCCLGGTAHPLDPAIPSRQVGSVWRTGHGLELY